MRLATRHTAAAAAAAIGLTLLTACGGSEVKAATEPTTRAAQKQEASEPNPTPTDESAGVELSVEEAEDVASLLDSAQMTREELVVARATFFDGVAAEPGLAGIQEWTLFEAGTAACDAMDAGKEFREVLIDVATIASGAADVEAVATLTGIAGGTLCPEHASYLD